MWREIADVGSNPIMGAKLTTRYETARCGCLPVTEEIDGFETRVPRQNVMPQPMDGDWFSSPVFEGSNPSWGATKDCCPVVQW